MTLAFLAVPGHGPRSCMGSSIFASNSDKRVESFVMEAFVTPLLRRRAAVVGSLSDMSFQISFSD